MKIVNTNLLKKKTISRLIQGQFLLNNSKESFCFPMTDLGYQGRVAIPWLGNPWTHYEQW